VGLESRYFDRSDENLEFGHSLTMDRESYAASKVILRLLSGIYI
jgi:hypothetical protein